MGQMRRGEFEQYSREPRIEKGLSVFKGIIYHIDRDKTGDQAEPAHVA